MTLKEMTKLINTNVSVRINLVEGEGGASRFAGFVERSDWLNDRVGRRKWTWIPNKEENAVFYYVPEHVALLFKLTWGGV